MTVLPNSSITPEHHFRNRRRFIANGISAAIALPFAGGVLAATSNSLKPTSLATINSYNNYYEFGFDKSDPSEADKTLITSPWTVEITGGRG